MIARVILAFTAVIVLVADGFVAAKGYGQDVTAPLGIIGGIAVGILAGWR